MWWYTVISTFKRLRQQYYESVTSLCYIYIGKLFKTKSKFVCVCMCWLVFMST